MQTSCLCLMGKKLLVALTMEGKFAGEGLQASMKTMTCFRQWRGNWLKGMTSAILPTPFGERSVQNIKSCFQRLPPATRMAPYPMRAFLPVRRMIQSARLEKPSKPRPFSSLGGDRNWRRIESAGRDQQSQNRHRYSDSSDGVR